jgi:hypothetical protein
METDNLLHEIWEDAEGLSGLVLAGEKGAAARQLLQQEGHKLIHTFYAASHFEAMTIYYAYYHRGEYTTELETDKLPYSEWEKLKDAKK